MTRPTSKLGRIDFLAIFRPALLFTFSSLMFGVLLAGVAPPLRGPDETAHFLRAYGISQGEILVAQTENGRKGVFLPASFFAEFYVFDYWQNANRGPGFSYHQAFEQYRSGYGNAFDVADQKVFVPYGGSEGYSPVAYLPQAAAAFVGRKVGLGFLPTFYAMRVAGLLGMTLVIAYAIAATPALKWSFVAIAMLPSALYGRAVINADAAALAYSLVVIAMFLRVVSGAPVTRPTIRAAWLVLCVLSKPPNVVFVMLEWLGHSHASMRRHCSSLLAVTFAALIAAGTWAVVSSADVAAWRLVELTGIRGEQFSPSWKLRFMASNPLAFPRALLGLFSKTEPLEFFRQLIGVLGLFDTVLRPWLYPAIGFFLAATFVSPICKARRLACVIGAFTTALAYSLVVFLIFYLVWTPIDADQIWGVQGRYFVPVLPLLAAAVAATLNRGPDPRVTGAFAVLVSLFSGAGSIDAILRADWNF